MKYTFCLMFCMSTFLGFGYDSMKSDTLIQPHHRISDFENFELDELLVKLDEILRSKIYELNDSQKMNWEIIKCRKLVELINIKSYNNIAKLKNSQLTKINDFVAYYFEMRKYGNKLIRVECYNQIVRFGDLASVFLTYKLKSNDLIEVKIAASFMSYLLNDKYAREIYEVVKSESTNSKLKWWKGFLIRLNTPQEIKHKSTFSWYSRSKQTDKSIEILKDSLRIVEQKLKS